MLIELYIRDLALIEGLEVSFGEGLNVLTGETGAGKSLLVAALELLSGQTPRGGAAQWVRKGAEEARVEGRFELRDGKAIERVAEVLREEVPAVAETFEAGLEEGEPIELLLGRALTAAGRTKAHVEQRPIPLRALKRLAALLLEIHGQNDHQTLFSPVEQVRLLDQAGNLGAKADAYRDARAVWLDAQARRDALLADAHERRDRRDLASYQWEELDTAGIEPGEHAALREERDLLRSATDLHGELGALVCELVESEGALVDRLRVALRTLERWRERSDRLAAPLEDLSSAEIHLAEAASGLASFIDSVPLDPRRLEEVEERLAELERLEAKYGCDEAGLRARLEQLAAELERLSNDEQDLAGLEEEIAAAREELDARASALDAARSKLIPKLTKRVEATLAALGLEHARLEVRFTPRSGEDQERFGPQGISDVEFFLAANPGEDPAPLRHVASGGEAARILLALRTELSAPATKRRGGHASAGGRTLVFDEIDAGVGGRLGPEVGAHLARLGRREQVLCVTHLPAIAAAADRHLFAAKEVERGRTRTRITALGGEERVREVADMIAGGSDHESARAEAERLLTGAGAKR